MICSKSSAPPGIISYASENEEDGSDPRGSEEAAENKEGIAMGGKNQHLVGVFPQDALLWILGTVSAGGH